MRPWAVGGMSWRSSGQRKRGREGGREGGRSARTLLLDVVALGKEELGLAGGGGLGPWRGEGGVEGLAGVEVQAESGQVAP